MYLSISMWHVYLYLHHYNSWTNNIVWLGTGKSLCMAKKLFMTQTTNLGSVSGCKSISHNFGVDSSNFLNIRIKVLQTIDSGLYYKPLLKTTFLFWWFFCSPFFYNLIIVTKWSAKLQAGNLRTGGKCTTACAVVNQL